MASTSSGDVNGEAEGGLTVKMTASATTSVHVGVPKSKESSESSVILMKKVKRERGSTAKDRISKMPPSTAGKRSSIYRGVTR